MEIIIIIIIITVTAVVFNSFCSSENTAVSVTCDRFVLRNVVLFPLPLNVFVLENVPLLRPLPFLNSLLVPFLSFNFFFFFFDLCSSECTVVAIFFHYICSSECIVPVISFSYLCSSKCTVVAITYY